MHSVREVVGAQEVGHLAIRAVVREDRPQQRLLGLAACGGDGTAHTIAVQTSVEPWTRPVDTSLITDGGDTCTFASTTSTTSVQLTPDADDLITPQSVLFAPSAVETLTEEGGDATTVLCYMAYVRVMAIGTSPRLYGLHVAEVYQ
jgi:hypothetical protein